MAVISAIMASMLRSQVSPSAVAANRAAELCPLTCANLSTYAATHHRRRTPVFGSARPQRVLVQAQAQAVSDAVAAPVAEVVKRLQGKVYIAGGRSLLMTMMPVRDVQGQYITYIEHDMCTAGVSGQLGSRIAKELLQNGVSVVAGACSRITAQANNACTGAMPYTVVIPAGVPEDDPADDALDFALQFELIKKAEAKSLSIQQVDFADASSFNIPRCDKILPQHVKHRAACTAT